MPKSTPSVSPICRSPVTELRAIDPASTADGKAAMPTLTGYAATYNTLSKPMGPKNARFRERILPGAFSKALADGADVRALYNHNPDSVLGRTTSGTLKLGDDAKGVSFVIDPPDTSFGRDAVTSIRRGDVDEMSFGFRCIRDDWKTENGERIRDLIEVDPFDISPTAFPAYGGTSVGLRSLADLDAERRFILANQDAQDDPTLLWQAREVLNSARNAFDSLESLIRQLNGITTAAGSPKKGANALSADDVRALSDAMDQVGDLVEKCEEACEAACPMLPPPPAEPAAADPAASAAGDSATRSTHTAPAAVTDAAKLAEETPLRDRNLAGFRLRLAEQEAAA